MIARILCNGPSIGTCGGHACGGHACGDGDLTIAVNRAALTHDCDVWAAGDIPMLDEFSAIVAKRYSDSCPALLTAAATAARSRDHGPRWPGAMIEFESLFEFLSPHALPWTLFTATSAIVYAASQGASQILCHGMDWQGEADVDGWAHAGNRTPARWELEAGLFNRLAGEMKSRGVHVQRVL